MLRWSDLEARYLDVVIAWDGAMARQDDTRHSLLTGTAWSDDPEGYGSAYQQRERPVIGDCQRGEILARRDVVGKGLADMPFGGCTLPRQRWTWCRTCQRPLPPKAIIQGMAQCARGVGCRRRTVQREGQAR